MRVVKSCEYIKNTELYTMKVNFMVHELYINFFKWGKWKTNRNKTFILSLKNKTLYLVSIIF